MDNRDFVDFTTAKRLKECGFNEPCRHFYSLMRGKELLKNCAEGNFNAEGKFDERYLEVWSAPTLQQAQRWFREVHNLHIDVYPSTPPRYWSFCIDDLSQCVNPTNGELINRITDEIDSEFERRYFDTFENAMNEGIKAALELINPTTE